MSRASSSSERNLTSVSYLALTIFILLLVLGVKYYMVFIRGPKRVNRILDAAYGHVTDLPGMGERMTVFMEKWELSCGSPNCPDQITGMDSCGFIDDTFHVWYTDSVEFPGLPTLRSHFVVTRPMTGDGEED